jgi:hypothetical protein
MKANAYDIVLFADIFLVLIVRQRMFSMVSKQISLITAEFGFVICRIFYLFFYIQVE